MQAEEIYKFENGFTVRPCINKYSSLWFCCECGANVISIDPPKANKFSHKATCTWEEINVSRQRNIHLTNE